MNRSPLLGLIFLVVLVTAAIVIAKVISLGAERGPRLQLVYRFDIGAAGQDGRIHKEADPQDVMSAALDVIRRRVDPRGIYSARVLQVGLDRFAIEFPADCVDAADIATIRGYVESLGRLSMRPCAYDDYDGRSLDPRTEDLPDDWGADTMQDRKRLAAWLAKEGVRERVERDPLEAIMEFNRLSAANGGPLDPRFALWFPMHRERQGKSWVYSIHSLAYPDGTDPLQPSFMLLNVHERCFTGADLDPLELRETADTRTGEPALAYTVVPGAAYGDLSQRYLKKCHAIILNYEVHIAPVFQTRIPERGGVISGGFRSEEIQELILILKAGELPFVPVFESQTALPGR